MNWKQLLSLKRVGDTKERKRIEQDDTRLGFEVDYDRIIFSSAFRSLQDKTQVIPLSKTDFVHTRLTHSLEVSVVGRSLGRLVGKQLLEKYPEIDELGYKSNDFGAIVATASLAHDIGNPPFGHSGEKSIGEYFSNGKGLKYKPGLNNKQWQDLIDFEGNANGFKIVVKGDKGVEDGHRLSYACLGAFMKYPKESLPKKPSSHIADKKYGFFQSEKEFLTDLVSELGLKSRDDNSLRYSRHPLSYLVEAADDICYTIIDFEDGINMGLVDEEYALEYLSKLIKDTIDVSKYSTITGKKARISYLRALSIGSLINEAVDVFMKNEEEILAGGFKSSLLDKCKYEAQINDIIDISVSKIYRSKDVIEKEISGHKIIGDLLDCFCIAVENKHNGVAISYDKLLLELIPEEYINKTESMYDRLLGVCCFIASMSDGTAVSLHKKIMGRV